jgi:hypothetical protein
MAGDESPYTQRQPGATIAIATLAPVIGVDTAMFSACGSPVVFCSRAPGVASIQSLRCSRNRQDGCRSPHYPASFSVTACTRSRTKPQQHERNPACSELLERPFLHHRAVRRAGSIPGIVVRNVVAAHDRDVILPLTRYGQELRRGAPP